MRPIQLLKTFALCGATAFMSLANTARADDFNYNNDNSLPPPANYSVDQPAPDQIDGGQVDPAVFNDQLAAYGRWVDTPEYGRVWIPASTPAGWQPYTLGHWAFTDCGWTWISDEPFGWATYHYGRWAVAANLGWCWVPGTVWGPAWVSWRCGDGYCGWAPLPPVRGFNLAFNIGSNDYACGIIPASCYNFVPERLTLRAAPA